MFDSVDSMVGQLTSIGTTGGVPVDTNDPWVIFVGLFILLVICAGGAAAKKSNNKKYRPDEIERRRIDADTIQYIDKNTGEVLFEGARAEGIKWKLDNMLFDRKEQR